MNNEAHEESNSENLVVSLPTKCTRIECATPVSKTQQDDLGCVADAMYVMIQDLLYHDFDPCNRLPGFLDCCDEQVVVEALLSCDVGQQMDVADHQVTTLSLV